MENPEFFQTGDQFIIEDLLDFSNDETMGVDEAEGGLETLSTDSTVADASSNSSFPLGICKAEPHFHPDGPDPTGLDELGLPYDDLADFEWLSNIVDESFSSDEFQKLQLLQGGMKPRTSTTTTTTTSTESLETRQYQFQHGTTTRPGTMYRPEISVPAKARSKRSRAAPGNWTSRLLVVSSSSSSSPEAVDMNKKGVTYKNHQMAAKKKEVLENSGNEGRKCLHCSTDKTPQWRTGPLGPKTLCNACGVRFKSGRLVPEYRPAASPTFVLSEHSNSHRKVMELRKQKEMRSGSGQHGGHGHGHGNGQFHHHHHQNNYMFHHHVNNNSPEDYLIHQHIEPDYRQMI